MSLWVGWFDWLMDLASAPWSPDQAQQPHPRAHSSIPVAAPRTGQLPVNALQGCLTTEGTGAISSSWLRELIGYARQLFMEKFEGRKNYWVMKFMNVCSFRIPSMRAAPTRTLLSEYNSDCVATCLLPSFTIKATKWFIDNLHTMGGSVFLGGEV